MIDTLTIQKYIEDPNLQGKIEPSDKSWILFLDKEGIPSLAIRTTYIENGQKLEGYVVLDELLPEGVSIASLMKDGI